MSRSHPDKIAGSNPRKNVVAEAERRTREVRSAYEMLKARRLIRWSSRAQVHLIKTKVETVTPLIAPSILSADFARLGEDVTAVHTQLLGYG